MKTTAKKTLSVLLSLLMVLSVFAGMTFTAGAASSGTCGDNAKWTLDNNGLLTVSGTGRIDNAAFEGNENIKAVVIESGIAEIGPFAFRGCVNLVSVDIPAGVTDIANEAFQGCSSLTSVVIPNGVTVISNKTFQGCINLTSVDIPASVRSFVFSAFQGCSSLTSVVIPNGVTDIPYAAFDGCSALTSVSIPPTVSSLSTFSFQGCSSLTSVVIPNGVTVIPYEAFNGCSALSTVIIPATVSHVSVYSFQGCGSLTDVYYLGSEDQWNGIQFGVGNGLSTSAAGIHYNCTVTGETPATCTEQGSIALTDGSRNYTVNTPARGHNWLWTVDAAADCVTPGVKHEECARCNAARSENTEIPAAGHVYVDHDAKAATCTEIGWDAYRTCENCDYSTYSEIPATGKHTTELVNAKEATATEDGYTGDEVCTVCGQTIKTGEIIPATGESGGETAAEGPGVCEYCGETHDVNTITGFFTDMLHDMLYIVMRLARFFCYEIFVS